MDVKNTLHMNIGTGESSYANSSHLQETVIWKALSVLKHTITGMANHDIIFGKCFKIADMGCSSSTNTLLVVSKMIDIVHQLCEESHHKSPQFEVYLNDLFANDFNTIFKMLPDFYSNHKKKGEDLGSCFISATPGSFYGRLFADQSLHLIHSSCSVQWLSQVPQGVENNSLSIYMAKSSPQNVLDAYQKQFDTDFKNFLQARSEEIVPHGCMVLTFPGRSIVDPTSDDCCNVWELLAKPLLDMVKEGLIEESTFNSFNIPYYTPCEDEVRNIIKNEGSFSLDTFNVFQANWDPYDTDYTNTSESREYIHTRGENAAKVVRAVTEPLLASHFGNSINFNDVFNKYGKYVALHLVNKRTRYLFMVVSLSKK